MQKALYLMSPGAPSAVTFPFISHTPKPRATMHQEHNKAWSSPYTTRWALTRGDHTILLLALQSARRRPYSITSYAATHGFSPLQLGPSCL